MKKHHKHKENTHLATLPYIQFDSHTLSFIIGGNDGLNSIVPKAIRRQRPSVGFRPVLSFSVANLYQALMASHNSCDASLFSECVVMVLAADGPWLVLRPCS